MAFQQKKCPRPGKGNHKAPPRYPAAEWCEEHQRYELKGSTVGKLSMSSGARKARAELRQ
jgi:hypothetical protein